MTKLSKSVQNCGLHDCTHNCFAITEKEALAAIEVMREAFIGAAESSFNKNGEAYGYQVIQALRDVK